ncbi:hypothetical protein [uncultured Cohaesibacter sp.]|uniref:hypothetical protein n=1 Tax=uncultured Cohaesibacter sp. TaxID=1002546 RepID=UPI00292D46FB|nr:hypothetical protein [uncultured Cohaesibacter sp.]
MATAFICIGSFFAPSGSANQNPIEIIRSFLLQGNLHEGLNYARQINESDSSDQSVGFGGSLDDSSNLIQSKKGFVSFTIFPMRDGYTTGERIQVDVPVPTIVSYVTRSTTLDKEELEILETSLEHGNICSRQINVDLDNFYVKTTNGIEVLFLKDGGVKVSFAGSNSEPDPNSEAASANDKEPDEQDTYSDASTNLDIPDEFKSDDPVTKNGAERIVDSYRAYFQDEEIRTNVNQQVGEMVDQGIQTISDTAGDIYTGAKNLIKTEEGRELISSTADATTKAYNAFNGKYLKAAVPGIGTYFSEVGLGVLNMEEKVREHINKSWEPFDDSYETYDENRSPPKTIQSTEKAQPKIIYKYSGNGTTTWQDQNGRTVGHIQVVK